MKDLIVLSSNYLQTSKNTLMTAFEEEIWQRVGKITGIYPLLDCDKCAIAVMRWLERWEVKGTILRLRTRRRSEAFITSNRHGGDESITENGAHYGVEVMGKVFDNISEEGLPREAWFADFSCVSGQFTVEEMPLSSLLYLEEA